jgi:type IV pilus assembly protein PilV
MSIECTIRSAQKGFTLIEIMVAVIVLSIGLLGAAGLQITGLKNNHSAQFRTEATIQAYAILERMRINKAVANAGDYDITMAAAAPGGSDIKSTDLSFWLSSLASVLPSGDGSIATDGGTGVSTISVQWDDSRGSEGSTTQTFTVSTLL